MRYLTADEIPESEKERRRGIEESIATYQAYVDAEWARSAYYRSNLEQQGRKRELDILLASIERRTAGFRDSQAVFRRHLPPYLCYGEDGRLHEVKPGG